MGKIKLGLKAVFDAPLKVEAQGTATAIGEDSAAHVGVESHTIDRGKVTFTFGKVTATASGTADAGTVYATAQTTATVADADFGHSITKSATGSGSNAGSDWAAAKSMTFFFAIDIKGIEFKSGHFTSTTLPEKVIKAQPETQHGNSATLSIDATAHGDNTLVQVDAAALATDDFSDATASVLSSAGSYADHHLLG